MESKICENKVTVMPKRTSAVPTAIRLELEPEEVEGLVKAVELYAAYLRSQQRSESLYEHLAEKLSAA